MFEENHIDDLMRSILENGQEEVPAHIWNGISEGLDKAERHRKVVLWIRRVGAVAAAAAIAVGVVMNFSEQDYDDIVVPESSDKNLIAVMPQETIAQEQTIPMDIPCRTSRLISHNNTPVETPDIVAHEDVHNAPAPVQTDIQTESAVPETTQAADVTPSEPAKPTPPVTVPVESERSWAEDERELKTRKLKTSLVFSGIAGSNNPNQKGGIGPMKSPALNKQYTKSTVEQTGTETTYGIPLSFGAGVRFRFTERWSLGTGLNYTLLTSRFYGKYIKVVDDLANVPVSADIRNRQHYIGVPINVYYDIVNKDFLNFYAYAGGSIEKCVLNKYQLQTEPVINHTESVKRAQLSVNVGLGMEFHIGRCAGIYLDPSLRYYFKNGQPKNIRTAQPLMLGFEMGLRFHLY